MTLPLIVELIILFQSLDGDMIQLKIDNIGSSETHGENIGEKWDILELN